MLRAGLRRGVLSRGIGRRFNSTAGQEGDETLKAGDLYHPFLKVFLVGTVTYFGLLMAWYRLEYPAKKTELNQEIEKLTNELNQLRDQKPGSKTQSEQRPPSKSSSSWKFW